MPKFSIAEFDRDYHTVTGYTTKEFPSLEAAIKYCEDESWDGYRYWVEKDKAYYDAGGK